LFRFRSRSPQQAAYPLPRVRAHLPQSPPAARAATLPANCLAVVLADGDPHSHAALLCQAAQRPYYSGAGDAVLALTDGAHIQITRASGEIHRLP